MKEYVKPPGLSKSGDNDALQALLASRKEKMGQEHFDTHFLVPPGCTFNAFAHFLSPKETKETDEELKKHYWYKDKSDAMYHKGDLLAHVAGFNNKEDSIQMLLDIAEWKQTYLFLGWKDPTRYEQKPILLQDVIGILVVGLIVKDK